jgi:hypothetical protein
MVKNSGFEPLNHGMTFTFLVYRRLYWAMHAGPLLILIFHLPL